MITTLKTPAAIEALGLALTELGKAAAEDAAEIGKSFAELDAMAKDDEPLTDEAKAAHEALCTLAANFFTMIEGAEAMVAEWHIGTAHARRDFMEAIGFQTMN